MFKVTTAWSDLLTLKTFYQFTGFQKHFYRLMKRIRQIHFFSIGRNRSFVIDKKSKMIFQIY